MANVRDNSMNYSSLKFFYQMVPKWVQVYSDECFGT